MNKYFNYSPIPSQVRTRCVWRCDFFDLQYDNSGNKDTNDVYNRQQARHDSTNKELGRNVISVDELVRGIPMVRFPFNMWYLYTIVDQPDARQSPVQTLKIVN